MAMAPNRCNLTKTSKRWQSKNGITSMKLLFYVESVMIIFSLSYFFILSADYWFLLFSVDFFFFFASYLKKDKNVK